MEYDYATGSKNMNGATNERFDPLYGVSPVDFGPSGIFGPFARSNINTPGYRFAVSGVLTCSVPCNAATLGLAGFRQRLLGG